LPDHRGHAVEAIDSWTQRQTCPRDDYEVVVIIDGREPEIEAEVAKVLSPRDQWIYCEAASLHDCYNAGARAARGQVLLFTESHVKADPDCVAEIIARFSAGDVEGLAVASGGIDETRFAGQEQIIYEEALPGRIAGGWNLCTVRGCAIQRGAFARAGGFRSEYGHFSELLLGAALRHGGARLDYAERASVWHFNSGTLAHFGRELMAFGTDEIRFRAENPNSPLLQYLGPCPIWDERYEWQTANAARRAVRSLSSAVKAIGCGNLKQAGRALEDAARFCPAILLGPRWLSLRAAWSVAWAVLLLGLLAWSARGYYRAFRAMWNGQIRRGRALEVVRRLTTNSRQDGPVVQTTAPLAKAA